MKKLIVLAIVLALSFSLVWAADSIKDTSKTAKIRATQSAGEREPLIKDQSQTQDDAVTATQPEAKKAPARSGIITRSIPSAFSGLPYDKKEAEETAGKWQPIYDEKGNIANPEPTINNFPGRDIQDIPIITATIFGPETFEEAWGTEFLMVPRTPPGPNTWTFGDTHGSEGTLIWWQDDWHKYYYSTWSDTCARSLLYSSASETLFYEIMISPVIDLSTATSCSLAWREYYDDNSTTYPAEDTAAVAYTTDGGTTWNNLRTYLADATSRYTNLLVPVGSATTQVGFHHYARRGRAGVWYIDKVRPYIDDSATPLWTEEFNNWRFGDEPVAGWTIQDGGTPYPGYWNNNDFGKRSSMGTGNNVAGITYGSTGAGISVEYQDEWLVTPAFAIGNGVACTLSFAEYYSHSSSGIFGGADTAFYRISVATIDGVDTTWGAWQTISFTAASRGSSSSKTIFKYGLNDWRNNTVKLAFNFKNSPDGSDNYYIDDVQVDDYYMAAHDVATAAVLTPSYVHSAGNWPVTSRVLNAGNNPETFEDSTYIQVPNKNTIFMEEFSNPQSWIGTNPPINTLGTWAVVDSGSEATPTWNNNDWHGVYSSGWLDTVAFVYYSPTENCRDYLITPSISCVGLANVHLAFKLWYDDDTTPTDSLTLLGTVDDWATTNIIGVYSGADVGSSSAPAFADFNISSWALGQANVKIAFKYVGNNGYRAQIDEVEIYEALTPTVYYTGGATVTNLPVFGLADATMTTTWNAPAAGSYQVRQFTALVGDEVPANDEKLGNITVYPHNGTGGPDAGFYSWIDNTVMGGPTFSWIDMSAATPHDFSASTDGGASPNYYMGGSFKFYGTDYDSVWFSCDGLVGFGTPTTGQSGNTVIPSTSGLENMIAFWWDDMQMTPGVATAYYLDDVANNRFVIQYNNISHWDSTPNSTDTVDVQIVLDRDDYSILVQYADFGASFNTTVTVGIENIDGTIGLQYFYEPDYGNFPYDGLAIQYVYTPPALDAGIATFDAPSGLMFVGTPVTMMATAQNYTSTASICDVEFYADAVLVGTVTGVALAGDAAVQVTCPNTWTPATTGTHVLSAKTVMAFDGNALNDELQVNRSTLGAAVTLPFTTDFEANDGGFVGATEWEWGTPTLVGPTAAHSGTNLWGTDLDANYENITHNVLYSTPINLTGVTTGIARFWMWHEVETNYDGANVKVSTDNGATWAVVTTSLAYDDIGDVGVPGLEGEPVWEGLRDWTQVEIDLAPYAGLTIIIRFDQSSDTSVPKPGLYVDDFSAFEPADDVGIVSIDSPGSITVAGTLNVIATAQNFTSVAATFDVNFYVDAVLLGTVTGVNLAGGASAPVTCPNQWTVAIDGDYVITATAVLSGDTNPANDTVNKTVSVRTAVTIPYSEGFDGTALVVPPTGWTVLNIGGPATTWANNTATVRSAPNSALMEYDASANQDDWLVMPPIDLTAIAGAKLSFYEDETYWGSYGDTHQVRIMTGLAFDPATAGALATWTPDDHTVNGFAGAPVSLDLTPYAGQVVWLAFRYTGQDADDWYIDDVSVTPLSVDVAAASIGVPTDVFFGLGRVGVAGQYRATINELGGLASTFDATLNVYNPAMSLVFTSTMLANAVPAGGSVELTFPDLFTPTVNGAHTLEVVLTATGDVDPLNNTVSRSLTVSGAQIAQYYNPDDGPYRYSSSDKQGYRYSQVFTALANGFLTGSTHYVSAPTVGGQITFYVWPVVGGVADTLNPLYSEGPYNIPAGSYIVDIVPTTPIPVTAGMDIAIGHHNALGAFNDVCAMFELGGDDGLQRDQWTLNDGLGWYLNGYGDWYTEANFLYTNPINPEAAANPSAFSEILAVGETMNLGFTIQNVGAVGTPDLAWSAASAEGWIQNITPGSGTIPGMGTAPVTFDINTTGLVPFTLYTGTIVITSNDPMSPYNVAVEVYTAPTPAYGLAQSGNFAAISVSNHGLLGDFDTQGYSYNWGATGAINYGGTFILGNSASTMLLEYGDGINNNLFRATENLNITDPFHPSTAFDGNTVLEGLGVDYNGYGFAGPDTGDFFIHEYILTNNSGASITGLFTGLYFDWDVGATDLVTFDRANNLIVQGPAAGPYYGLSVLNGAVNTLMGVSQDSFIYDQSGWDAAVLYGFMNSGADLLPQAYADMGSMLSFGPFDLAPGQVDTVAFAVIGGSSTANVSARAELAADVYSPAPTGCVYLPGDINGNGVTNGIDVGYGVNYFKGAAAPPISCPMCPQPAPFYAGGDVNGNCVFNGIDITFFVNYLKGIVPSLLYCPTCAPAPAAAPAVVTPGLKAKAVNSSNQ